MVALLDQMKPLEKVDSDYEFNGVIVPRVTKIIKRCIHSDGLMYWANSLGFKHQSYSKTLNAAAAIGSECHASIDNFLDDQTYEAPWKQMKFESRNAYKSFLKWFNDVSILAWELEVIYHEKTIICKYFGGTIDGLYKINGKIYLVDYKTSNHITFNYCLQLAAYRYMLRVVLGIEIDGCIILQLSKENVSYNEYVLNFDNPYHLKYMNECEVAFMSLVFAYYNITRAELGFKNINWGLV